MSVFVFVCTHLYAYAGYIQKRFMKDSLTSSKSEFEKAGAVASEALSEIATVASFTAERAVQTRFNGTHATYTAHTTATTQRSNTAQRVRLNGCLCLASKPVCVSVCLFVCVSLSVCVVLHRSLLDPAAEAGCPLWGHECCRQRLRSGKAYGLVMRQFLQCVHLVCASRVCHLVFAISCAHYGYGLRHGLVSFWFVPWHASPSQWLWLWLCSCFCVAQLLTYGAYALAFYAGGKFVKNGEMQLEDVFRVFTAVIFAAISIGRPLPQPVLSVLSCSLFACTLHDSNRSHTQGKADTLSCPAVLLTLCSRAIHPLS